MITTFKNRKIDYTQRVFVYRKLFKNSNKVVYSIKQKGVVVAHGFDFKLFGVVSNISKLGQIRARDKKVRNVHAYLHGFLVVDGEINLEGKKRLHYNPFQDDCFWYDNEGKKQEIHFSTETVLTKNGVFCNVQTVKEEIEWKDCEEFVHKGLFEYVEGNIPLHNWIEGRINGLKTVLWWYDGLKFNPNTKKEIVCICDEILSGEKMPFLVGDKIVGYFSPSTHKLFKYKFPIL